MALHKPEGVLYIINMLNWVNLAKMTRESKRQGSMQDQRIETSRNAQYHWILSSSCFQLLSLTWMVLVLRMQWLYKNMENLCNNENPGMQPVSWMIARFSGFQRNMKLACYIQGAEESGSHLQGICHANVERCVEIAFIFEFSRDGFIKPTKRRLVLV